MKSNDDVVVLENAVGMDGVLRVHLMSNMPVPNPHPKFGEGQAAFEAGVHHFRLANPMHGAIHVEFEGGGNWNGVLWSFDGYANMRSAIKDALQHYLEKFGEWATYAFVAKLPKGIEDGFEVADVMMFSAEWMIPGFVLVRGQG